MGLGLIILLVQLSVLKVLIRSVLITVLGSQFPFLVTYSQLVVELSEGKITFGM